MKVHTSVVLQLVRNEQGIQMLLTSQSKELRTYCLYQELLKNVLLELRDSAACCILFKIHIDLETVYFQNTDQVDYKVVFHIL